MDTRALDAEQDAVVDGHPLGIGCEAIAAVQVQIGLQLLNFLVKVFFVALPFVIATLPLVSLRAAQQPGPRLLRVLQQRLIE